MKFDVEKQYLENYPYYGRFCQDKFVNDHFFHNKKNGVFVDIGAYDGVESSNTLFFEESLNWNGICVEPIPEIYQKLEKNRKCSCFNCCASSHDGIGEFLHVKPGMRPKKQNTERTSNYEKLSGLIEFYSEEHKKIINDIILKTGGEKNKLSISCRSINSILDTLKCNKIDLLSIDTEGSEMHILKSIDFRKYSCSVIIVEVLYDIESMDNLMNTLGYKYITKIGYDAIYVKNN